MAQEITLLVSRKLDAYLKQAIDLEGFGDTRGEVIQRFVWDRVNELIASHRLVELEDSVNPRPRESTGESYG